MKIDSRGYDTVIIMGMSKVAEGVTEHVLSLQKKYNYKVCCVNNFKSIHSPVKQFAEFACVSFKDIFDKDAITALLSEVETKTLVISAGSTYIFPKSIIEKDNLTIINFHNAILPYYPGLNTPSWVIYDGEPVTGITWHFVSEGIDEGNIICTEWLDIGSDEKAYHLAGRLMDLAVISFENFFEKLLNGEIKGKAQDFAKRKRLCLAKDVPGGGKCSAVDSPEYIYRLLRAMDYGKNDIFPEPLIDIKGNVLRIIRYAKTNEIIDNAKNDTLYFPFEDGTFLRIKVRSLLD